MAMGDPDTNVVTLCVIPRCSLLADIEFVGDREDRLKFGRGGKPSTQSLAWQEQLDSKPIGLTLLALVPVQTFCRRWNAESNFSL